MNYERIVIDTSVWISIALSVVKGRVDSAAFRLLQLLGRGTFRVGMSTRGLYELGDVLADRDLGMTPSFTLEFLEIVGLLTEPVDIIGLDMGCRDDADDHIVEAAYNFAARALITRDADLAAFPVDQILGKRGCEILGISEFLAAADANAELT